MLALIGVRKLGVLVVSTLGALVTVGTVVGFAERHGATSVVSGLIPYVGWVVVAYGCVGGVAFVTDGLGLTSSRKRAWEVVFGVVAIPVLLATAFYVHSVLRTLGVGGLAGLVLGLVLLSVSARFERCPDCAERIPANSAFCPRTGARLPTHRRSLCLVGAKRVPRGSRYCPHCGEALQ